MSDINKELYVLALYEYGQFSKFIRKSRNYSIIAYDNIASASRGKSQSKREYHEDMYEVKIVRAIGLEDVE